MRLSPALAALLVDGPPLRIGDLAQLSGLSSRTVRLEIAAGELPACRLRPGCLWLIQRVDAIGWLKRLGVWPV